MQRKVFLTKYQHNVSVSGLLTLSYNLLQYIEIVLLCCSTQGGQLGPGY